MARARLARALLTVGLFEFNSSRLADGCQDTNMIAELLGYDGTQ
jgi:hypothetical protein